jgi:hypothetical protein
LRRRECRKDELAAKAKLIERVASLGRIECAISTPTLCAADDVGAKFGGLGRILSPRESILDGLFGETPCPAQFQWRDGVAQVRVGMLLQPVECFHDVAVGIAHDAFARISHG